jgi:hypothetical protein
LFPLRLWCVAVHFCPFSYFGSELCRSYFDFVSHITSDLQFLLFGTSVLSSSPMKHRRRHRDFYSTFNNGWHKSIYNNDVATNVIVSVRLCAWWVPGITRILQSLKQVWPYITDSEDYVILSFQNVLHHTFWTLGTPYTLRTSSVYISIYI